MDSDEDDACQYLSENSSEQADEEYNLDVEILLSIIFRFPEGIGHSTLLKRYLEVKSEINDPRLVHIGPALVDFKGSLIDYKTFSDGVRIYSAIRKKITPTKIHPIISEVGSESQLLTVSLAKITDCNCFVVYFQEDFDDMTLFDERLQSYCKENSSELEKVQPWQINNGDCFVYYCKKFKCWIRLKVVNCDEEGRSAICASVDYGDFYKCKISDLRVAPELSANDRKIWRVPKEFQQHPFAIRCCLDVSKKPFDGFPSSAAGLLGALCGEKPMDETLLKIRFLSYDSEHDAFTVDVLSQDGNKSKLLEAAKNNPDLLVVDADSSMGFIDEENLLRVID